MKQHSIIPNSTLTSPKTIIELPSKNCVDNKLNDPSIIKNTDHVNVNDKYFNNVRMVRVNELPEWKNDLTPKFYVDKALSDVLGYVIGLHESSRNKQDL